MNKILTFGLEMKNIDEAEGIIEGYASTFKNVDQGFDMVMPGAFKKTIRDNKGKFPILASHNPSEQIGWNLEAKEDDTGLWVRGTLDIAVNQKAKEHFSLVKQALKIKAPAGLSIGYSATKWDMSEDEENGRYRKLREIRLYEYSLVAFPMNTEATATAVKQFERWLKTLDGDAGTLVKNFVARMQEEGFNDSEIKSALTGAAALFDKPEPNVSHLFDEAITKLKSL